MNPSAEKISEHSAYEAADSNKQDLYHWLSRMSPQNKKPLLQFEVGVINPPQADGLLGEPHRLYYLKKIMGAKQESVNLTILF